ncbi:MAG: helix-turn-helix protein [Firmicutes bacterium]|nr:helix-turn-helix protein [Bacillota bacterium]
MNEIDTMPDVLTAKMIGRHLHLSLRRVYELLDLAISAGGIPSFRIGRSKRVMKEEYRSWIAMKKNSA